MAKTMGIYNANRKCKKCSGKGYVFETVNYCGLGLELKARNEKTVCRKCHGRGLRA